MKKLIILLAVISLVIVPTAISQNITLRFTGATSGGDFVLVDSVKVQNTTRSWSETVVYPDTVLTFTLTGISSAKNFSADIASYPNPFNGATNVAIAMPQSGDATLQLLTLTGQKVAERTISLEAGNNVFEVRLQNPQVYILAVTTSQGRRAIKLLNRGIASENVILHRGNGVVVEKRQSTKPFQIGDALKIVGYTTHNGSVVASREISQSQMASENFTLFFNLLNVAPTVTTDAASSITDNTAVSGGEVTSDGGDSVTARGECWSTVSGPTLSDNHTANGSGMGRFTSQITGLLSGTTYYVRAYATNSAGTAYGNEDTIVTTGMQGALSGVISVSSTQRVRFSRGNLQYTTTGNHAVATGGTVTGTWRFAEHQYDFIGIANRNISNTYAGWIDLFGWATSGWNNGNNYYQPYNKQNSETSSATQNGGWGYGPRNGSTYTYSLVGTYLNSDWGVYNAISNGGNVVSTWRTLSKDEWNYLLETRTTTSGKRYAKGTVNGICGLMILPDNWNVSTYTLNNYNDPNASFTVNDISLANWNVLETAGVVFLPAGGFRNGISVENYGSIGYYWSTTFYNGTVNLGRSYGLKISNSNTEMSDYMRCNGMSVRLVVNAS